MSSFACPVKRITISPHSNADALELAQVDDFRCVVLKGEFRTGDLAVYVPVDAIVPDTMISEMGLTGKLAGPALNRVKAIRLRGIFSQGLLYRPSNGTELVEGVDMAEVLGITKYVPPIPIHMDGKVSTFLPLQTYTDIENLRRFPGVLLPGEEVVAHEKLHGTCSVFCFAEGEFRVSSKGMSGRRLAFVDEMDEQGESANVYWRIAHSYSISEKLRQLAEKKGEPVSLYGETVGVQDLKYGLTQGAVDFRAFDIKIGETYLPIDLLTETLQILEIPQVPLLYRGPFDLEVLKRVAGGKEQFTGREKHIREGVVIRPVEERDDLRIGRVIVKLLSEEYLLRKGETTEYE